MVNYTIKEIFDKINSDIKETKFTIFNRNFASYRFNSMTFNADVSYNNNFSEEIRFIIRNVMNNNVIENWTVNIKDLDYIKNKLEVF